MIKSTYALSKQRQQDAHYKVMHILQKNPHFTQRKLSQVLGISLGKLNYCLKALVNKGWIKVRNFTQSKSKYRYSYLVTPKGISEKARMTKEFLDRKISEYDALRKEIDELNSETSPYKDTK